LRNPAGCNLPNPPIPIERPQTVCPRAQRVFADDDLIRKLSLPEAEIIEIEARRDAYVAKQRAKFERGWARIDCRAGIAIAERFRHPGPAFVLLFAIYDLVFKTGKNPIKLTNVELKAYGIDRYTKMRGLRQLTKVGAVSIEQQGKCAPLVTYLWAHPHPPRKIP
jgi:hypothetical protein